MSRTPWLASLRRERAAGVPDLDGDEARAGAGAGGRSRSRRRDDVVDCRCREGHRRDGRGHNAGPSRVARGSSSGRSRPMRWTASTSMSTNAGSRGRRSQVAEDLAPRAVRAQGDRGVNGRHCFLLPIVHTLTRQSHRVGKARIELPGVWRCGEPYSRAEPGRATGACRDPSRAVRAVRLRAATGSPRATWPSCRSSG